MKFKSEALGNSSLSFSNLSKYLMEKQIIIKQNKAELAQTLYIPLAAWERGLGRWRDVCLPARGTEMP